MNKSELTQRLAKQQDLPVKQAAQVVDVIFATMSDALCRGERVEIRGLGSFKVKHYGAYRGRNPRTGRLIDVEPKKMPHFRPGQELKGRVDTLKKG